MLYHLFDYLQQNYNLPGAGVFQYISFRAAMAVIISLVISLLFGKSLIEKLRNLQAAETIRTLGLDGEEAKKGTPTMGGLIILAAILIPTILFAKLNNVYVLLMIFSTIWLGVIGFIDGCSGGSSPTGSAGHIDFFKCAVIIDGTVDGVNKLHKRIGCYRSGFGTWPG